MKKRRTRGHIIEDLGFNHVERQVLLAGCTLQRIFQDYGYDGYIHLFDERGEYTNGLVLFQLKSTDRPNLTDMGLTIDLSSRDLELWLYSTLPMVLFLYDAQQNVTRYVNLREYFEQNRTALRDVRKFVRIYIPPASIFDVEAMQNLRATINF